MTFTQKTQPLRVDSQPDAESESSAIALSTPSGSVTEDPPPPPVQRKTRTIIWVDCPSCYGFGTTKIEWGEWYQTCLDCNGNGLLEAEPDEEEQPQTRCCG